MLPKLCRLAPWLAMLTAGVFLLPLGGNAAAQKARVNPNAATIKEFMNRVDGFVALHKKLESTLPHLPKQTTPTEVDRDQRALGKLIQQARKDAKQGDLFTPRMQTLVRTLLKPVFTGPEGVHVKAEILDNEYKGDVKVVVNGRYPDEVPMSTMPPQVLRALPPLPEDLEYRFIRQNLILLDVHAHIIVDFIERSFT